MQKLGLIGIALGTLIGMIYRGVFHVHFTSKLIPSRSQSTFYRKLFLLLLPCFIGCIGCFKLFPITDFHILPWIQHAVIYGLICGAILLIISFVFFKREVTALMNYINIKNKKED